MNPRRVASLILCLLLLASASQSQEALLPPGEKTPLLQFDVDGPTAAVTAMAMRKDKDGETLYAAGLDKVVRAWKIKDGAVTMQASYRVPIGPGNAGAINALAVSGDGTWLAVAGRGLMRRESNFQTAGVVIPEDALSDEMLRDLGNIYLVDLTKPPGNSWKVLRGHTGAVRALAFTPSEAGKKPTLVSAANDGGKGKTSASVLVWDVEKNSPVARLEGLPATLVFPGLVARRIGDESRDVRVAIAWPEEGKKGSLRVWDAGAPGNARPRLWEEGKLNFTAEGVGKDRLLTGYLGTVPSLRLHRISGDAGEARSSSVEAAIALEGSVPYVPWGMSAVSESLVAVLLRPGQEGKPYLLAVYDVSGEKPVEKSRKRLTNTSRELIPVLAAVPGGQYLAVAGYDNQNTIRLFAVRDLLSGQGELKAGPSILSPAVTTRRATFITRAGKPGIWLGDDASTRLLEGGRFFDIDTRKLSKDSAGWQLDRPDSESTGWTVFPSANLTRFQVRRGNQDFPAVALGKNQNGTAFTLIPPKGALKQAILAVAHMETVSNEARISLFDVNTGKPFLRLSGHLQRINHLACSGTLPLLASVAGDQTVCVWSLRDLDATSGTIEGLVLADDANKVVVHTVESGSAAEKGGLKKGDEIQGQGTAGGQSREVKSALAFYLDLAAYKPDTKVELKVSGKTLTLPVARGVDERKPLFSLFLPRDGGWVGWSPLGFYDASGPEAEKLLGWHTNTGREAAPVTFAKLEMYRKNFYREGVLKVLADGKIPGQAAVKPPVPDVRISNVIPDLNTPHLYVVRERKAVLEVELDADYVVDEKDERTWQVSGPQGMILKGELLKPSGNRRWAADLKGLDWKAGDYRITMLYRSASAATTVSRDLTLRYLPPAPILTARIGKREFVKDQPDAERRLEVMDEKLTLDIEAKSSEGDDRELSVQALHRPAEGKIAVVKQDKGRSKVAFRHDLTLTPGVHFVQVLAGSTDAVSDNTSRLELEIVFKPRPEKVDVRNLRIVPEGDTRTLRNIKGFPNVPIEVQLIDKPDVTLHALVEGSEPLTQLELTAVTKTESLLGEKPGKSSTIAKTVRLPINEPQRLVLRASTKRSDPAVKEIWVLYSPELPRSDPVQYPERVTKPELDLKGVLKVSAPGLAYSVSLQVTDDAGKETVTKAQVSPGTDKGEEIWQARARLAPGENRVKLLLNNEWQVSESATFRVRYVRPPEILAVEKVKVGKSPLVQIKAAVQAPSDLPPTRVKIDGKSREADTLTWEQGKKVGDRTEWRLTINGVPVNGTGKEPCLKEVTLEVGNRDGDCEKPVVVAIEPPDKVVSGEPARIDILNIPTQGQPTNEKDFQVRVRVSSESPFKSIQLCRNVTEADGKISRVLIGKADLRKVKSGPPFELEDSLGVTLKPGNNSLCLVVENEGHGEKVKDVTVSYVVPAPRVIVEEIKPLNIKGKKLSYARRDGRLIVDATEYGLLMLSGSVQWDDSGDGALNDAAQEIRVLVNGIPQFPVALGPRGTGMEMSRRTFKTPIALTESKNNVVQLKLPKLPYQQEGDTVLHMDCTNPMKDQRLHVLLIGVDVDDAKQLKENFFKVLGVQIPPVGLRGAFKKDPFKQAHLYHVVTRRDATRENILTQLKLIESEIEQQQRDTKLMNDIIILYYQGSSVVAGDTSYLETKFNRIDPTAPVERYALDCRKFANLPGRELLLLNAIQKGTQIVSDKPPFTDPLMGVISYANLKGEPSNTPAPRFFSRMQEAINNSKEGVLSEMIANLVKFREEESVQHFNLSMLGPLVIRQPQK